MVPLAGSWSTQAMKSRLLTEAVGVVVSRNLPSTGGEVLLDFFLVQAVDTNALQSLEELAGAAEVMKAKIILRGVNVEIYKVLTLAGLTSRFSFLN